MSGIRILIRVLLALVFVALLVAGAVAIYQAGFTHGALTNLSLPEGEAYPMVPLGHPPLGWHAGPRIGLLALFPLLCFGSFFFLLLLFGFGFFARKRAWMYHPEHWKHPGPPPWGPGCPPWAQDQPRAGSETPTAEAEESES